MLSGVDGWSGSERHVYFDTVCTVNQKKTNAIVTLTISPTGQANVGSTWRATSIKGSLHVAILKTRSCGASSLDFHFSGPLS